MATVKQLIEQLQKVDNKYLDVLVLVSNMDSDKYHFAVEGVEMVKDKILIFTEYK
jgi:hypothetical protein